MTRTKRTLVANDGYEVCLFPMDVGYISQYSHQSGNNIYNAYDLGGLNDSASGIREEVYAPCSMTVVKSQLEYPQYTNNVIFKSDNPVYIPGETTPKTLFICMTHCDDIAWIVQKGHFNQGDLCYYEGTYGGSACQKWTGTEYISGWGIGFFDIHLHIEVTLADESGNYEEITTPYYSLKNSRKLEEIFYVNEISEKFAGTLNGFVTFDEGPFDPSNKSDGWHRHNGTWYYVENHACVTGWKKLDSSWYYFEADGKMKTGWLASGTDWYWLSPTSGVMQVNSFVDNDRYYVGADGKMLRSGWTLIEGEYYYFKDKERDTASKFSPFTDGEKVTNVWIASGSSWYYTLSDGKMAKNCQIKENGKYYAFNDSGACLNAAGQTVQYNTTTYPMKSLN